MTGRARNEVFEIPVPEPATGWTISIVTAECGLYAALRLLHEIRHAAARRDRPGSW
jgi:hypothetical protein